LIPLIFFFSFFALAQDTDPPVEVEADAPALEAVPDVADPVVPESDWGVEVPEDAWSIDEMPADDMLDLLDSLDEQLQAVQETFDELPVLEPATLAEMPLPEPPVRPPEPAEAKGDYTERADAVQADLAEIAKMLGIELPFEPVEGEEKPEEKPPADD